MRNAYFGSLDPTSKPTMRTRLELKLYGLSPAPDVVDPNRVDVLDSIVYVSRSFVFSCVNSSRRGWQATEHLRIPDILSIFGSSPDRFPTKV